MTPAGPWICPTCSGAVSTSYCPECGERPIDAGDLSLRGIANMFVHAFSAIDSRLLRTFRHLVTRPGTLTVAYVRGQRIPFAGPLQVFLIANLLFFATQSLTDLNVLGATLESHLDEQDWAPLAQRLVARRLSALGMTLDSYAPLFDHAAVVNAKSLVILMVLPFALIASALFYRERQPIGAHVVFALHFYAFLLLLFCAALALAEIDVLVGGKGLKTGWVDLVLSGINLVGCWLYLFVAVAAVYGDRGALRIARVSALTVAAGSMVLGYRFLIFLITLYGT